MDSWAGVGVGLALVTNTPGPIWPAAIITTTQVTVHLPQDPPYNAPDVFHFSCPNPPVLGVSSFAQQTLTPGPI